MGFVKDAWNGITGKTSSKAAEKAGNIQADSSKYAADISQKQYEQTRQDQMPWLNAGANALGKLQDYTNSNAQYKDPYGNAVNQALGGIGGNLTTGNFSDKMQGVIDRNYRDGKYTGGLSLDDFQADPSYEFRKQQGMDGIQSSAAASGGLLSGAALKALNQHNSNLASQEYNNAWQRDQMQKQQQYGVDTGILGQNYNMFADQQDRNMQAQQFNIGNQYNALNTLMNARSQDYNMFNNEDARLFNQLANLAGVGQQTATNLGSFGAANAQNQGNAAISAAGAQAMGLTGAAAAKGSAWNNLLGLGVKAAGII